MLHDHNISYKDGTISIFFPEKAGDDIFIAFSDKEGVRDVELPYQVGLSLTRTLNSMYEENCLANRF